MGHEAQLLLKVISILPVVMQEQDPPLYIFGGQIVNSIVLSLLRLPDSCWEFGNGKPTEALEQILLSEATYDFKLTWITRVLHERGYSAYNLYAFGAPPSRAYTNTEYFIDLLARTAENDRLEIHYPTTETVSRAYDMIHDVHEVKLTFNGKKYCMSLDRGGNLPDSQLQAQGGSQPTIVVVVANLGTSLLAESEGVLQL
ncbi:hypothetical protein MPER_05908 [Moniliophthora perniciosa FA553]|nr:hypothetical protein MPER_05908 [Moniliophthora perniciosa FA553]